MLFDYLFLTAIGLDWLILGLVIFAGKALLTPFPDTGKNLFKKSFFSIVLFFLVLLFLVKVSLVTAIGWPLKNFIASVALANSLLIFVLLQLLFAFVFLVLGMLLFGKSGFTEEFQPIWTKRISLVLIITLFVDFFTGLGLYLWVIKSLFQTDLVEGSLAVAYQPLSASHYWLALGLILALVVYFIFYLALKHRNSAATVTGMSLAYLIVLLFVGLLGYYSRTFIAPDARFPVNNFALYLTTVLWLTILFLGLGSLLSIILFFRKRKFLKNEFYFRYILIRLGGFHAVNVVGISIISLLPIVFFTLYR